MSSLDGESDKPVQIVRQFAPGIDHYPAYTTLELILGGYCHVAWISHRNPYGVKRKRIGTERSVAVRQKAAMERFMESRAILRDMLARAETNGEIARKLEVCVDTVRGYIEKSSELQTLAAARPGNRPAHHHSSQERSI